MRRSLFLCLVFTVGCAHAPDRDRESDRKTVEKELSGEMSLKADRDELKELRKEIPTERQKANDELALYLQLMKQGTEQPQMVRDKFTVLVQKKRTSFRDKVAHLRDSYHRSEAKRREEFLAEQKDKRDDFMKDKHSSAQTHSFFDTQDRDRQDFFSSERSRRQSFEAEIDAQSRDFDSYMREKTNEFNEQYRLYSKQFSEKPREKNAVTGEGGDYKSIDKPTNKTLSTED
jgi:hypothetical protein